MKSKNLKKFLAAFVVFAGTILAANSQDDPEFAGTPTDEISSEDADAGTAMTIPEIVPEDENLGVPEENSTSENLVPEENSAGGIVQEEPAAHSFFALISNSPFKSILKSARSSKTASNQIQFRGIMKIGNETEYGLYDPATQQSYWVKLKKQNRYGIFAESFDAKTKTLTIQSTTAGKLSLTLPSPEESPLAISSTASYRQAASGTILNRQNPQNQQQQNAQNPQQQNQQNQQNQRQNMQRGTFGNNNSNNNRGGNFGGGMPR